jgi:hypothetical protein
MRLWSALQSAMRTRKTRRIGLAAADRLVAGNPPGPDQRGLGVLLDAATAPPSVEELAGETAAVARYVAAFRATAAEPAARDRVRVPRSAKIIATKVAVGVAILAAGGTAVAAETGNLPAGVQHFFSALGVPAPDGGPQPTVTGAGPAPSHASAGPTPTPTPAASRGGDTSRPAETTALGLCRAWDDGQAHGKPMPAASRRALAAAAGGEKEIADFCARLLAISASATNSLPSTGTSTGSGHSTGTGSTGNNGNGNDGGNGDGDGNAGGNGNGNAGGNGNGNGKGQPSPIPTGRVSQHP